MFEFVKKLMLGRELDFDRGKILLLREPICLMPVRTVADIVAFTKNDQKNILYYAGKLSGSYWFEKITQRFYERKMPLKDIIEWGNNIIAMAGYGISILEKFGEKDREFLFRLENSTVSELTGPSKKPVDHLYRGFIAGAGTRMIREECDALEIKCKATGAPYCAFVVKPSRLFNPKSPLVREQIGARKARKKAP